MKKLVLIAIVSLFALVSNAQFKKSDKILEGTVSYAKSEGTDAEYSISPSFGYFLSDKFAIGISAGIGTNEDGDFTEFGGYGRLYFLNIGKNLMAYTQLDLSTASNKLESVKTSSFSTNVGVGANYFISKNLALSAHICDLMNYTSVESTSSFSIGFTGVNNPLSSAKFGLLLKF